MTEYTEDQHAERLLWLLEQKGSELCGTCPGTMADHVPYDRQKICSVCLGFVGLAHIDYRYVLACPCYQLANPTKTTWLALEAKGYLD